MAKKLRIGIIGMSKGNGHPYSWSAIFNGYNKDLMKSCPFPVIPEYLSKQNFPEDSLGDYGEVTHIWTQDIDVSKNIAEASLIHNVVDNMTDMIGDIDAVLLARDDAMRHKEMAMPFLLAGIPIFIDKPLALSIKEANAILESQLYENQIFSCSSIRFADELNLNYSEIRKTGTIKYVEATIPKKWDTYAIHIIEPVISRLPNRGKLINVQGFSSGLIRSCIAVWENVTAYFKVTGSIATPIKFTYYGENNKIEKEFSDSYNCFKRSLLNFIKVISDEEKNIPRKETLEIIQILEEGNK